MSMGGGKPKEPKDAKVLRQRQLIDLADLEEGEARGLVWDPDEAAFAIEFFSHLRLAEGQFEGHPEWKTANKKNHAYLTYKQIGRAHV